MAILQARTVGILAWLLQSLREGCLCLESQTSTQNSGVQRGRPALLATTGLWWERAPKVRELQLSGDVPVQNRGLELWDHGTRRQRKRVSDTDGVTGSSKAPHASTASFHFPSLKTKMDLNVLISSLCL